MRGHIRKRGDKWVAVFDVGRNREGRRKQKWISYRTKREAERGLADMLNKIETGGFVEPTRMPLEQYLERWIEHAKTAVSARTAHRYEELLRHHVIPRLGTVPLKSLSPLHLQGLYRDLHESGRRDGAGGPRRQLLDMSTV